MLTVDDRFLAVDERFLAVRREINELRALIRCHQQAPVAMQHINIEVVSPRNQRENRAYEEEHAFNGHDYIAERGVRDSIATHMH